MVGKGKKLFVGGRGFEGVTIPAPPLENFNHTSYSGANLGKTMLTLISGEIVMSSSVLSHRLIGRRSNKTHERDFQHLDLQLQHNNSRLLIHLSEFKPLFS